MLLSDARKPEEALESYKTGQNVMQRLAGANPAVTAFQMDLAQFDQSIGRLHALQGRFADAFAHLDPSITLARRLVGEHPDKIEPISILAESYSYRGWARMHAGQPDGAASDLRQAVITYAKHPSLQADMRFDYCRALSLLAGLGGNAKSGVTADEAREFSDQAVATLENAINAGWARPVELKEPDFDALRGREDFRRLVKALETNAAVKDPAAPSPEKK